MQLFFGPNNTYFFTDGRGTYKWRAPADLTKEMQSRPHISQINSAALGEDESWFLSFTEHSGKSSIVFDFKGRYKPLRSWLISEGLHHDWESVYISLGKDDAFFATSDQGHRWRGIPVEACDAYQRYTRPDLFQSSRVASIDLGYKESYLGFRIDRGWFWDLNDQYPELEKLKIFSQHSNVQFAIISAFAPNQHFVAFKNGTAHWSIPPEWADDLVSLFKQYAQKTIDTHVGSTAASPTTKNRFWRRSSQPSSPPGIGSAVGYMNHASNAINSAQSSLDTINNITGTGSQGMHLVSQLASTGNMVGQLSGQYAGAMAACAIM